MVTSQIFNYKLPLKKQPVKLLIALSINNFSLISSLATITWFSTSRRLSHLTLKKNGNKLNIIWIPILLGRNESRGCKQAPLSWWVCLSILWSSFERTIPHSHFMPAIWFFWVSEIFHFIYMCTDRQSSKLNIQQEILIYRGTCFTFTKTEGTSASISKPKPSGQPCHRPLAACGPWAQQIQCPSSTFPKDAPLQAIPAKMSWKEKGFRKAWSQLTFTSPALCFQALAEILHNSTAWELRLLLRR